MIEHSFLCFLTVLSVYCLNTYYLELTKSTKYTEVETGWYCRVKSDRDKTVERITF